MNAAVFSAFLNLLYLAPTLYMLQVYDRVVPTRGFATLGMLTLIFVGAVASLAMLDYVRTRLLVRASERLDLLLASSILDSMVRLSSKSGRAIGAVHLREFDIFRQTMTGMGVLALFDAPWAPIYVLVCFMIHPAIGAMALVGASVLMVMSWLNERGTSGPLKEANLRAQGAYSGIDMMLGASGVVESMGMRRAMVTRHMRERFEGNAIMLGASFKAAGYGSLVKAIRLLLQSLALGLGALLAIEQQISAGAIFAASLLISRALQPIELVNGAWKNLIHAHGAYRQIVELFERAGTEDPTTQLPTPKGDLLLEGVGVATPDRDRLLVGGVSFSLNAGELLGVIGPSGAGKSTLAKAIVGISPVVQGAVRLDGTELRNWSPDQLGRAIGYVPQEPGLFRGTIKENIARFNTELAPSGVLDEEVVRAAQLCGAHDFIVRLPRGYDTELGPGGSGLSVGQSQRIALARALLGSPVLVVLDEPNAALDADGEAQLSAAIEALRSRGVTLIVIAHRAGILANADKLLVMNGGRVEMFGERNQVLLRLNAPQSQSSPQSQPPGRPLAPPSVGTIKSGGAAAPVDKNTPETAE